MQNQNKKADLYKLSVLELRTLIEHLHLGLPNLKKQLNKQELKKFLLLGKLDTKQHSAVQPAVGEKSASFALIINIIFSTVLGTWIGVVEFMGLGLGPRAWLFAIIITAVISAFYFGYHNFKNKEREIEDAFDNLKLHNIQYKLLQHMREKYNTNINLTISNLDESKKQFLEMSQNSEIKFISEEMVKDFSSKEELKKWLNELNIILNRILEFRKKLGPSKYTLYKNELELFKTNLEKDLGNVLEKNSDDNNMWAIQPEENLKNEPIKLLTRPYFSFPSNDFKPKVWIKENYASILKDFIPTIIGGFGSIFLYLSCSSSIAKIYEKGSLHNMLNSFSAKIIGPFIAVGITIYFGHSFLNNVFKSYKRDKSLAEMKEKIAQEEGKYIEKITKLNTLKKVKLRIINLLRSFNLLNKVIFDDSLAEETKFKRKAFIRE